MRLWSITMCKNYYKTEYVLCSLFLCRSPNNSEFSPPTLMKGIIAVRWPATARHRRPLAAWRSPKVRRVTDTDATKPRTQTSTVTVTHQQFLFLIIQNRGRHMKSLVLKVRRYKSNCTRKPLLTFIYNPANTC